MNTFNELNISKAFVDALAKQNITVPTSIQAETIGPILEGKDLIGEAVTGSGKTLAYLLPSLEKIDVSSKNIHTIILTPTHELAIQINNVIKDLAKDSNWGIKSALIIGNVNIKRQVEALKGKPHIVVGTAGRMLELIKAKKLKSHFVKTIVIDEADKLLSDSNLRAVNDVIKTTQRDRQLLAFSASISDQSKTRAIEQMKTPEIVLLKDEKINNDISHYYIQSRLKDKITTLRKLIHGTKPTKSIVFINKNELILTVSDKLNYHNLKSVAIYGNATKSERKKALDAFKSGKANILIASDLVARGLDLQDITHVFNLDIPEDLKEYTHRVGRSGRAGKSGTAVTIVTEKEVAYIKKIQNINNVTIESSIMTDGKLVPGQLDTSQNKKTDNNKKYENFKQKQKKKKPAYKKKFDN